MLPLLHAVDPGVGAVLWVLLQTLLREARAKLSPIESKNGSWESCTPMTHSTIWTQLESLALPLGPIGQGTMLEYDPS